MADFSRLSAALGEEFLAKKKFERETPERELRMSGETAQQEDFATRIFHRERERKAKESFAKTMFGVDAQPISDFAEKMSEEHKTFLNKVSDQNDPEALRQAENRVKFDIIAQEDPEFLKNAAIAFPDLSQQISGIVEKQTLGQKRSVIEKTFEERSDLSTQEHYQRLREIRATAKANLRYLSRQIAGKKDEKDPRIRVAQEAINKILTQLDAPPGEDEDKFERQKILGERLNAYTKFINDHKAGRPAELPETEVEEERLLPDEISGMFGEE
jgi:hypothetical protein